jgi:hypothetical protein
MTKINKSTELRTPSTINVTDIQTHFDEMNADGWNLIAVDNLVGWYRFFWEKEITE